MNEAKRLPLPKRLRERRLELDWTQKDVVDEVKRQFGIVVRPNHLSNCEQGVKSPSLPLLAALAAVLETSTDYLLGLSDNKLSVRAIEADQVAGIAGEQLAEVLACLPREKQTELQSVAEAYIYRNIMELLLVEIGEAGGDAALNTTLDKLESSLPDAVRRLRLAARGRTD